MGIEDKDKEHCALLAYTKAEKEEQEELREGVNAAMESGTMLFTHVLNKDKSLDEKVKTILCDLGVFINSSKEDNCIDDFESDIDLISSMLCAYVKAIKTRNNEHLKLVPNVDL